MALRSGARRLGLLLIAVFIPMLAQAALNTPFESGGRRVALVIGNAEYQHISVLNNPVNDSVVVADVLEKQLCFDSVTRVKDATRAEMNSALSEFADGAKEAQIALLYFAGQGLQAGGIDLLAPVEFQADTAAEAQLNGIALADIASMITAAGADVTVLLIDTNFDTPYPNATRGGLKPMTQSPIEKGFVILHATQPGQEALDGTAESRNSPFAEALVEILPRTDMGLLEQLNAVSVDVYRRTETKQIPYLQVHMYPPGLKLRADGC